MSVVIPFPARETREHFGKRKPGSLSESAHAACEALKARRALKPQTAEWIARAEGLSAELRSLANDAACAGVPADLYRPVVECAETIETRAARIEAQAMPDEMEAV